MPRSNLNLKDINPLLEGNYTIETLKEKVKVKPVFAVLKEKLKDYAPEKASEITGVHPDTIRMLARNVAKAKAVANVTNQGFGKYYHGDLMERSIILVFALCGHFGKKGSGYNGITAWSLAEGAFLAYDAPTKPSLVEAVEEIDKMVEPMVKKLKEKGYSDEMIAYEFARDPAIRESMPSGLLFYYLHGGIGELNHDLRKWDPHLKRNPQDYIDEALQKKWQYLRPPLGKDPRVFIQAGGNMLRRVRGYPKLIDNLLPKLKLLVNIDVRMSSSGLYSDFILPCAGYYERFEMCIGQVIPNPPVIDQPVKPLWESKSDWEIHCLLAEKIQERAQEKGIMSFKDKRGNERRFDRIYEDLTFERAYTEEDIEKLIEDSIKVGKTFEGATWKELKKRGSARVTHVGRTSLAMGNATDIKPDETITPHTWHVEKKIPWPTFTRRIQFYIDHDLYLELGEELPTHKDSIKAGGDYPLQMTGGHARWSIHTVWRDSAYMLNLQRGEPIIYISTQDAKARKIMDGDRVKVWNDLGDFEVHAKVSPAIKPGQAVIYHAWEPYQFKGGKSHAGVLASPVNPIELAGDDFHLRSVYWCFEPGGKDKDTRVEVSKMSS